MQISLAAPNAVSTPVAAERPPAAFVYRDYASVFMALPGVVSTGWGANRPDEVHLSVQGPELVLLADQALVDAVDGVRLAITDRTAGGVVPDNSWVRNPTNVMRALAALPGVVGWNRFAGYTLLADTHERAAWLRKIVSPTVGGSPLRVLVEADLP
jgi:hypothetical protein